MTSQFMASISTTEVTDDDTLSCCQKKAQQHTTILQYFLFLLPRHSRASSCCQGALVSQDSKFFRNVGIFVSPKDKRPQQQQQAVWYHMVPYCKRSTPPPPTSLSCMVGEVAIATCLLVYFHSTFIHTCRAATVFGLNSLETSRTIFIHVKRERGREVSKFIFTVIAN